MLHDKPRICTDYELYIRKTDFISEKPIENLDFPQVSGPPSRCRDYSRVRPPFRLIIPSNLNYEPYQTVYRGEGFFTLLPQIFYLSCLTEISETGIINTLINFAAEVFIVARAMNGTDQNMHDQFEIDFSDNDLKVL